MSSDVVTNLRKLNPSRKRIKPGDVFVMLPPDDRYLFGRVMSTEVRLPPIYGMILIYIYNLRTETQRPVEWPKLGIENLLLPPLITNRLNWSRGYFETIEHRELAAHDVLSRHRFYSSITGRYYDDEDNELPGPVEPVGSHGVHSFRTIDDAVSKALGIPLVPFE